MSLSPEQLKFIARACDALNELESEQDTGIICFGSLEIIDGMFIIGKCEDVYGNGYLFVPFDNPIRTA